jgi:hypothetical protein
MREDVALSTNKERLNVHAIIYYIYFCIFLRPQIS